MLAIKCMISTLFPYFLWQWSIPTSLFKFIIFKIFLYIHSYTLVLHSFATLVANVISSVHHLVQTAHDNSLMLSYGGQGSDPHLPSTKYSRKPS